MSQRTIASEWTRTPPLPAASLQRQCACGQHTPCGGQCDACGKNQASSLARPGIRSVSDTPASFALATSPGSLVGNDFTGVPSHRNSLSSNSPAKALTVSPAEADREKPSPTQGSATIKCDGSGGYEILYNGWAGATCGTKNCVTMHESSHIADWKAKWPDGCKGQPKGYLPKGDAPDNPLMTGAQYRTFLKESECKAHTIDLQCAEALPKTKGCEKTIDDYIKLTTEQKANWCPSLSRGAKIGLGIGGGALVGAAIGSSGGLVGAMIGAGVGALVGGIAGALL